MRAARSLPAYPTVAVSRLARYIAKRLGDDPKLRWVGVRGEVSGVSMQPNGNVYFDLKDREAVLNCVVWSETAAMLPPLANGREIVAVGAVSTFQPKSRYQLVVQFVEQEGVGRLHALYEELKRRLDAEGLFAANRKRPLPRFPFAVGLVSSRSANGAGDFLVQAAQRAPHVAITLFETPVQGAAAAGDIVRAIERASRAPVDLVVVARGGGSYEDLFVFSDERVVRALARCAHPTVSAIGHDADAPLIDFAADYRAATPSSAAHVLPLRDDLLRSIGNCGNALQRNARRHVENLRLRLDRIQVRSPLADGPRLLAPRRQAVDDLQARLQRSSEASIRRRTDTLRAFERRLAARNPQAQLAQRRQRLALALAALPRAAAEVRARAQRRFDVAAGKLTPAASRVVEKRRERCARAWASVQIADPQRVLKQGYAIVRAGGRALHDASEVAPGTAITAELARGTLTARVERASENGE